MAHGLAHALMNLIVLHLRDCHMKMVEKPIRSNLYQPLFIQQFVTELESMRPTAAILGQWVHYIIVLFCTSAQANFLKLKRKQK